MKKKQSFKLIIILLTFVFFLSGCSLISLKKLTVPKVQPVQNTDNNSNPLDNSQIDKTLDQQLAAQTQIKKFTDWEDLKNFLEANPLSSGMSYGLGFSGGVKSLALPMGAVDGAQVSREISNLAGPGITSDAAKPDAGPSDYSPTNVQVAGVDEADIIKTDGKYIYAVANNDLFIIDAYPADNANIISKINFKSRPENIYINGDYLVIYGENQNIYNTEIYKTFRRGSNFTFLKIFDIKDKANPKQIKDLDFEGNYNNSRMIGDWVYFVTTNYSYNYIDDPVILPRVLADEKTVVNGCADAGCVMPPVYYFDIPYDNYNFTTITAINMKDAGQDMKSEVYLMSANQNMYVSQNNIYITYTKYISEFQLAMAVMKDIVLPRLSAKDHERIAKIEQVDNYILSDEEKSGKIFAIIKRFKKSLTNEEEEKSQKELEAAMKKKYEDISKELEKTVIHKIAINSGSLEYKTFGEVTGQVLNQFSMDEQNGFFRIATTKNRTWSQFTDSGQQDSYNNLYVLDENLKPAGKLEGLAPGERIYSARFMQNRAYMVTFKQTDPLFVIDLADPNNPKVLGQLKISGFSNYLHPYDDHKLIGLGKETTENEWGGVTTKGIKLSLFDVADVANPKEIDKYVLGDSGSDSIALSDHKAFLFSKEKNLLVIPASIMEAKDNNSYGQFVFSGAVVFKVDDNGFTLKGKIDHSDGGIASNESETWGGIRYYDNTVERSLFINDVLYTFSPKYLKMNNMDNLDLIKFLELKKELSGANDDFNIIN